MGAVEKSRDERQFAEVVSVEVIGKHKLRLGFSDGLVREIDLSDRVGGTGVFGPLADPAYFAQVKLDHELGTIVWPNGLDLDPDVLHGDFEPERRRT